MRRLTLFIDIRKQRNIIYGNKYFLISGKGLDSHIFNQFKPLDLPYSIMHSGS